MRIKWTTLYVDDQEKALQFYTDMNCRASSAYSPAWTASSPR